MKRTPIWQRLFAPDDLMRQAIAVQRAEQAGLVDGIEIDFRHKDIPPGQWEPPLGWYTWRAGPSRFRQHVSPFVFPFEHHFVDSDLSGSLLAPAEFSVPIRAYAGDRITVDRVETVKWPNRDFDDPEEQAVKGAYLKLTRDDGSEIVAGTPLLFLGCTNIRETTSTDRNVGLSGLAETLVYERFAERIRRNDPWKDEEGPLLKSDPDYSDFAAIHLHHAESGLEKIFGLLDKAMPMTEGLVRWEMAMAKIEIMKIASAAMQAGFNLARHELEPAEVDTRKARAARKLGPETQRNHDWWNAAERHWTTNPTWLRNRVINEMILMGEAVEDERRSLMRSLKKHPLCPAG